MKLIDILVRELPRLGGWPEGCDRVVQDCDGLVKGVAFGCKVTLDGNNGVWIRSGGNSPRMELVRLSEDSRISIITIKQYEAALAASKVPVWDGEGLPPIGCEVEVYHHPNYGIPKFSAAPGTQAKVVSHQTTTDGNDVAVIYWDENGGGKSGVFVADCLRPIRTEAERKREDMLRTITHAICSDIPDVGMATAYRNAERVLNAIAAGKIPGVKLED